MSQGFDIPILLIIFNRPLQTASAFRAIREIRPSHLFVAADGAREGHENDAYNCSKCREIVQQIDWDCKLTPLFREKNLGCKLAVSGAITWFFEQVEMGIILEDDCVAEKSFFSFCETLLHRYKDDDRIMHIGGTNFQPAGRETERSYYFSRLVHVWGWASWRRAWAKYDVGILDYSPTDLKKIFSRFHFPEESFHYWNHFLGLVKHNKVDTWDYQWTYALWKNNGLGIIPELNMISNIGFDSEATHTTVAESPYANMRTFSLQHILHPAAVEPDSTNDTYIFRKWFVRKPFRKKVLNTIKRFFFIKTGGNEMQNMRP